MPPVIAVAGGSSGLGRAIIEALKDDQRYIPIILSRKANSQLEKDIGVHIIAADYSNEDALVELLEEHSVGVVISTLNTGPDPIPELNLIRAAHRSKTTRRYIPNVWSAPVYTEEHGTFPLAVARIGFINLLKTTSLEWTVIYPGIFMDFYVPELPTFSKISPLCVDTVANIAAIPGTGEYPVVLTHTLDIGKYIPPLLGLKSWEKHYYVAGDKTTFIDLVALAEQAKGVQFKVTYDSAEDLKNGKVTELPGFQSLYEMLGGGDQGKQTVLYIVSQLGLFFQAGAMDYKNGSFLNEIFPEVKPLGVKEAFAKAYAEPSENDDE